jgi:hypothetical protein
MIVARSRTTGCRETDLRSTMDMRDGSLASYGDELWRLRAATTQTKMGRRSLWNAHDSRALNRLAGGSEASIRGRSESGRVILFCSAQREPLCLADVW